MLALAADETEVLTKLQDDPSDLPQSLYINSYALNLKFPQLWHYKLSITPSVPAKSALQSHLLKEVTKQLPKGFIRMGTSLLSHQQSSGFVIVIEADGQTYQAEIVEAGKFAVNKKIFSHIFSRSIPKGAEKMGGR